MATRQELKELARLRLREAEHLYREQLYDGCVYLCGYVVEFALKARICRVLKMNEYPESGDLGKIFRTHDFDVLKVLAGLTSEITVTANNALFNNWSLATQWNPGYRYLPVGTSNATKAGDVLTSIKDKPNGVLTWISKRW